MKTSHSTVICVLIAAAGLRAEVPAYHVQYLGDGWTGTGINRFGDVCGSMSPDGTALLAGVALQGSPFELLPLPEGMLSSRAHDINDEGVIVGSVCPNEYVITQPTAAVWRPSADGYTVEVLAPLPGDAYCAAYALNNLGDIVGASGFWGWNLSTGVQFTAHGTISLPEGMMGVDINDQRVLVTNNRLLDLDSGELTVVSLPEGRWQGFAAAAINNNNDFCGYILGYSGCSTFPLRYRQGVGWEFLGGCATTTSATAINDRGDTLSYYYSTASGVTFVPEGYFNLAELIDPSEGEYYVQWGGANGINDNRQIVAAARNGFGGPIGAILMTPMATRPDCGAIRRLTASCRSGKLIAKVVSSLPEGTELTVMRNGGDAKTLTINARGKGKVKWSGRTGPQELCLAECPQMECTLTDCG